MKILLAPDSFKGTLTAAQVCSTVTCALRDNLREVEVDAIPVADGGEGTADSFVFACGAQLVGAVVTGPQRVKTAAEYAVTGDTAIIEMAKASGLPLTLGCNNPVTATTLGTGELILAALEGGSRKIVIGIGGSATTDGGLGCIAALGARLLDKNGRDVAPDASGMAELETIDLSGLDKRLSECEITVLCDVTNPLYGENGAAYVYAPQKGADKATVEFLDSGLRNLEKVVKNCLNVDLAALPGSGAAGGLGYGLRAFLGAELKGGAKTVLDLCGFDERAASADIIVTGEGCFDFQSLMGKVPAEVVSRANGKNVVVLCGVSQLAEEQAEQAGFCEIIETNPEHLPFCQIVPKCEEMLYNAAALLAENITKKCKKY